MKKLILITTALILILNSNLGFAQSDIIPVKQEGKTITKEFKVYGNCGMCESRIEKATVAVKGVKNADWNKETKVITVAFNEDIVKLEQIHKAISEVGHDTDLETADLKIYNKLPGCCKYRIE